MHKVLCFGGRDYVDHAMVDQCLTALRQILGDFAIINGGARGADSLCAAWGRANGLPVITVDANWTFYDKRAGHLRNGWMLELCGPTYAVGFAGGRGTADMAAKVRAAGVTLWEPCK